MTLYGSTSFHLIIYKLLQSKKLHLTSKLDTKTFFTRFLPSLTGWHFTDRMTFLILLLTWPMYHIWTISTGFSHIPGCQLLKQKDGLNLAPMGQIDSVITVIQRMSMPVLILLLTCHKDLSCQFSVSHCQSPVTVRPCHRKGISQINKFTHN